MIRDSSLLFGPTCISEVLAQLLVMLLSVNWLL